MPDHSDPSANDRPSSPSTVDHVEPPRLNLDERLPEGVPDAGIFDTIFDEEKAFHRHLKDVWQGKGEPGDPMIPQDEHEHQLVLQRLREESDNQ